MADTTLQPGIPNQQATGDGALATDSNGQVIQYGAAPVGALPSRSIPGSTVATSDGYRSGISDLGSQINDALNTQSPYLANLQSDYNTQNDQLKTYQTQLDQQRDQALASINSSFDTNTTDLKSRQANETGRFSNTLARIGGYLGESAGSSGAMQNLNDTHQRQLTALESKRQDALSQARNAYSQKDFQLAQMFVKEAQSYHDNIIKANRDYTDTTLKVLEAQRKTLESQTSMQLKQQTQQNKAVDFATKHNLQDPFYDIGGTWFNSRNGKAYSSMDEAVADGAKADGSNVQKIETKGDTYAINSKQQGPDGKLHQVRTTYDAQGNIVNRSVEGVTEKGKTTRTTPSPDNKIFVAVDNKFAQANEALKANPGWDGHMDPTFYQNMKQAYIGQVAKVPKDVTAAAKAFDAKYSGTLSPQERANLGIKGTPRSTSTSVRNSPQGQSTTQTTRY